MPCFQTTATPSYASYVDPGPPDEVGAVATSSRTHLMLFDGSFFGHQFADFPSDGDFETLPIIHTISEGCTWSYNSFLGVSLCTAWSAPVLYADDLFAESTDQPELGREAKDSYNIGSSSAQVSFEHSKEVFHQHWGHSCPSLFLRCEGLKHHDLYHGIERHGGGIFTQALNKSGFPARDQDYCDDPHCLRDSWICYNCGHCSDGDPQPSN